MAFVLTLVGAMLAVALELLEALAIVLAVAVSRRARDAVIGAAAAVAVCALAGALLGPVLVSRLAAEPLKLVIGVALLLFGLEWLRKGVLRLAGRRARSSAYDEYLEERDALAAAPVDGTDWAARTVAFKGVLLEGLEVILIVTALAGSDSSRTPALLGAGLAVLLTVMVGLLLHRPLRRVPETELKYGVGILLSTFGTFFVAEGLDVSWPLDDASLLLVAAVYVIASQAMVRRLREGTRALTEQPVGAA
jgi:Ca2+/H+ antiporter, TMEM165/GDT1 family